MQVEPDLPPSPKAAPPPKQSKGDAAKSSAPKIKKPKVKKITTADIAAGITSEDLTMVLRDFEERYSRDESAQLERVADYFEGSFREVDIPFNKTVLEQSVSQVCNLAAISLLQNSVYQCMCSCLHLLPDSLGVGSKLLVPPGGLCYEHPIDETSVSSQYLFTDEWQTGSHQNEACPKSLGSCSFSPHAWRS